MPFFVREPPIGSSNPKGFRPSKDFGFWVPVAETEGFQVLSIYVSASALSPQTVQGRVGGGGGGLIEGDPPASPDSPKVKAFVHTEEIVRKHSWVVVQIKA